jgi:3'-phosphoadenosine 5'-phosphosulfate sulfotransferase (PAPS reductase)/FAD synthetase
VCSIAINNDPAFRGGKVLVVTGERRQESAARSRYAEMEEHRSTNSRRRVDQWRPVLDWSEAAVWDRLRSHGVNPHPAYHLGWGRVSCLSCIFGNPDQWASVRALAPDRFEKVARYEERFGVTIKKGRTVRTQADLGTPYAEVSDPARRAAALSTRYAGPVRVPADEWTHPAGAFRSCGGPS